MAPTVLVSTSRQATKKYSLPAEDGTGQVSVGGGSSEKYQENGRRRRQVNRAEWSRAAPYRRRDLSAVTNGESRGRGYKEKQREAERTRAAHAEEVGLHL